MTYTSNDIVAPHANHVSTTPALDVISFGKDIAIDSEIREMLPRIATGVGQRLATGTHATHEFVARLCVMEAFGAHGSMDSGAHQRRCDIAHTLYTSTISLLVNSSRTN